VKVLLVDKIPVLRSPHVAVIYRTTGPRGEDFILLQKSQLNANSYDSAVRTLLQVRASTGEVPAKYKGKGFARMTIGVRGSGGSAQWKAKHFASSEKVVDDLRRSTARTFLDGYGSVPSTVVTLPTPERRQK